MSSPVSCIVCDQPLADPEPRKCPFCGAIQWTCGKSGCEEPLRHRHCITCPNILNEAEVQTCTHCITTTRRNLIDIEQDYAMIAEEILGRAGASTPSDPTGRHNSDSEPMLGGDLLVMLGPGSPANHAGHCFKGATRDPDDGRRLCQCTMDSDDVDSILGFLERWDTDWRITFDMPAAKDPATVARVTLFLLRNLAKAAAEHPAFDEFHGDVRKMRQWLTAALRNGPQRSPVPCIQCGRRTLERPMPRPDGQEFEWQCAHCHLNYDWPQYLQAMRESGQTV